MGSRTGSCLPTGSLAHSAVHPHCQTPALDSSTTGQGLVHTEGSITGSGNQYTRTCTEGLNRLGGCPHTGSLNRWRLVIDLNRLNTFLHKVQNGNSIYQDLLDSRAMGIVNRLIRCLPSHPHPPKLKEIPKVLPQVFQFTSLPFGLATAPGLDSALVKPPQERWLKCQDLILRLHSNLF